MVDQDEEQFERAKLFLEELDIEDYGFIFNRSGKLKAIYVPIDQQFKIPPAVRKLFKLAGLPHPDLLEFHTVH